MAKRLALFLWCALCVPVIAVARAEPPAREAARHFQRATDLYVEGDFRGALVEFKRAYAIVPRAAVIYNIAETEYQLQDYAAALQLMERFLAETGPAIAHRAEVEAAIPVLRGRVGRLVISSDADGAEISVDDESVGKTPLAGPVLVSLGRRKVAASLPGRAAVSRSVDVVGGETRKVELDLGVPAATVDDARSPARRNERVAAASPRTRNAMIGGWVVTGLLLVATATLGALTLGESNRLRGDRAQFPATRMMLDADASRTTNFAISSDVLGVATAALASTSIYFTVSWKREARRRPLTLSLRDTSGANAAQ